MIDKRYHEDISTTRIGTVNPRAYYIPFDCEEDALSLKREQSRQFTLLSGKKWRFKYFDSFDNIPKNITDSAIDVSDWVNGL